MSIRYLLDTHAILWAIGSPKKLGAKARQLVDYAPPGTLGVPAAAMIEIGWLLHADKVDLAGQHPRDFFAAFLAECPQIPISLDAVIAAPALGLPHGDPYDRLIVAEALALGVPLITKDGNITDSGLVRVVW